MTQDIGNGADTATPKGTIRSKEFDDLYFSAEDGLAETRHVFLDGNGLPAAWEGKSRFTICETGFGTGLNFLAVWKLFSEHRRPNQVLHFISFEKYPLDKAAIRGALDPFFTGEDARYLAALCTAYPEAPHGATILSFDHNVTLHLLFGDVNDEILNLESSVDAWFLDGFKPSTNPDMWSETLFYNMARLSHTGTTLATFTAAGFVRRGLGAAGFTVQKVKGFGHKRDMTVGIL